MTIAQVSQKYELSADTLRYYERIGLLPPVTRTAGGIRDYSESDCAFVEFIKCMRSVGMPIETLIEYVALFQQGEATVPTRMAILLDQRTNLVERIGEMQETLQKLDHKIAFYQSQGAQMPDK